MSRVRWLRARFAVGTCQRRISSDDDYYTRRSAAMVRATPDARARVSQAREYAENATFAQRKRARCCCCCIKRTERERERKKHESLVCEGHYYYYTLYTACESPAALLPRRPRTHTSSKVRTQNVYFGSEPRLLRSVFFLVTSHGLFSSCSPPSLGLFIYFALPSRTLPQRSVWRPPLVAAIRFFGETKYTKTDITGCRAACTPSCYDYWLNYNASGRCQRVYTVIIDTHTHKPSIINYHVRLSTN